MIGPASSMDHVDDRLVIHGHVRLNSAVRDSDCTDGRLPTGVVVVKQPPRNTARQ